MTTERAPSRMRSSGQDCPAWTVNSVRTQPNVAAVSRIIPLLAIATHHQQRWQQVIKACLPGQAKAMARRTAMPSSQSRIHTTGIDCAEEFIMSGIRAARNMSCTNVEH